MSLLRKIGFGVFVVLAAGFGIWGYFNLKENKKPSLEALSVLPDSCLVYLHSPDLFELNKKLNSQSLIADKLKLFGEIDQFCNVLQAVDSLFHSSPLLEEEMKNNSLHVAVYPGTGAPNWLVAFNVRRLGNQEQVNEAIGKVFRAHKAEQGLYEFKLKSSRFYFSLSAGVVLVSNAVEPIYRANQSKGSKLIRNAAFVEFRNSLEEKSLLSVFVDHAMYLKSEARKRINLSLVSESGYSAGAIDVQPSQVKVNGYLSPGKNEPVAALLDQTAQPTDFVYFLPANTCDFKAYGFSSFPMLKSRLTKLKGPVNTVFWKTINDSALYNLEEEFFLNLATYALEFETHPGKQSYAAVQVSDTLMAMDHLKAMSDSVIAENADSLYQLRLSGQKDLKLFEPLLSVTTRYAAKRGSWLYFSNDRHSLLLLLRNLKNAGSIAGDESFMAYRSQHFYERFNFMTYTAPNQCKERIPLFFNLQAPKGKDPFANFRHFSFSLACEGARFKFRWQLLQEAEKKAGKEQSVLWTLLLDSACSSKAEGFVNHLTKENELLIQDQANTLYLINAKGTVLWQKALSEKIRSPIFTVDAFKNNKYQLLFSSNHYLHLIDRNGHYVSGYPVKLPAEASSPLSLFDYDKTRDYRLFIACKNKVIYNYSLGGVKQAGFAPFHTDQEVKLPVQYAKVGPSDYLVAVDEEGRIYTFSRRGEGRIGLRNKTTAACSGFYLDASGHVNSTYLVYVDDKNNSINKISFTDKKELKKLDRPIENASLSFGMADETGDMAVILTTPAAVLVYDLNGNLLLERFAEGGLSETRFYKDETSALFMTLNDLKEALIYDWHSGKSVSLKASAFPWIGYLFNDPKKYAVVTDGRQVSCVLLN